MIGTQLGHYEVVRKLGAGGMGEVFVANDPRLNREVALKVLPPGLADDPDRLARFEREAKTVAALNHPNIVTIYSVEEADGVRFMTMELIRGRTLDEFIPDGGMPVKQFLDLAVPLANAVAAAHARGVQHRDLKPANVMVDDDGRVKVLDFGLATQRQDTGPDGVTQMLTSELTGEGKIIGTVSYMSPEQAEGRALDHRSDIFSLGILMYEMATGKRPFQGDTNLSILSSILKDEPDSVSDVSDAIPFPVARLIQRALAKSPGQRYQSAIDLKQDLVDIQRDLQTGEALSSGMYSGPHSAPRGLATAKPWRRWAAYAAGALALTALAVMLPSWFSRSPAPTGSGAVAPTALDGVPSVAVFYFDNISGDEELQWLRTGLTDMLVTDLSQTASVRVLATDRLYSMLQELEADQADMTSFDVVQRVAARARMNTVIVGSFARAGEELRINVRIQDPRTSDVLASNSVQGDTEEVFDLVDEITDWVEEEFTIDTSDQRTLVAGAGDATGVSTETVAADVMEDRDLEEVTTRDVEAFRMYAEGVRHNLESREEMAIPLLEAAVEKDPDFAMAHAKLSVAHGNAGDQDQARLYARRAFELSDRLPPRERFYIRGRYLSMNPDTMDEAIDSYQKAVEMFPDHLAARHNLSLHLMSLERYEEAIPHLEELRELGHRFAPSHERLATAYAIRGDHDRAIEVLTDFVEGNPDNAAGYAHLAEAQVRAGDFEAGLRTLDRADELDPSVDNLQYRSLVLMLAERWDEVTAVTDELVERGGRAAFFGHLRRGVQETYFGRIDAARGHYRRAAEEVPVGSGQWMWAMGSLSGLAEITGDYEAMLVIADEARERAYTPQNAQQIEILTALSNAYLANEEAADAAAQRFGELMDQLPLPEATRTRVEAQVDGLLALARRDDSAAVRNLRTVLRNMPAIDYSEEGAQMRYILGESLWRTGDHAAAAEQFEALETATLSRVGQPDLWLTSLWYLGAWHAERGERPAAERYYRKYLEYRGDSTVAPDRIAQAREYLDG